MGILRERESLTATRLPALERAILETLAYFDVFDYPLRRGELWRYLHGFPATLQAVEAGLYSPSLQGRIEMADEYVFLSGRGEIVRTREARGERYRRGLPRILTYGRALGGLPFVRMVALTGSSAMQNGDDSADLDFLIVTKAGRLWLARAFAILLGRWTALNGYVLCPNVLISERRLLWPQHEIYTAHEIAQMAPLSGMQFYGRMRRANQWVSAYLPNAIDKPSGIQPTEPGPGQRLAEAPLEGRIGDRLEGWEMVRKIARLSRQGPDGAETCFTAEVCQGNFDQHGHLTRQAFAARLARLDLEPAVNLPLAPLQRGESMTAGSRP